MSKFYHKVIHSLEERRLAALCIVTAIRGSVPGKTGSKMLVFTDGTIDGTVGGGAIEKQVIDDALTAIRENKAQSKDYNLGTDLSMTCGGSVTIYIEPLRRSASLYIFGAGHIGSVLARYAPDMDFETTLIDWRSELLDQHDNGRCTLLCKPYLEAAAELEFDENTYCVIVTPNHEMDEEILAAVGRKKSAYTGLIGSRRKIETLRKRFLEEKLMNEEELNRIDMPIGLKIGAVTPAEIAVSIIAKLIEVKNSKR